MGSDDPHALVRAALRQQDHAGLAMLRSADAAVTSLASRLPQPIRRAART